MNRRQLLRVLGLGAVTAASLPLLEACAPAAPATQKPADAAKPAEASKPAEAAKPADAAKPAEAAKPADTSKPAAQAPAPAAGAPKRGGTLTVVVQNDWVSLDPLFNTGESTGLNMLYGTWVRLQRDAKTETWGPTPDMVAEWDIKPDAITMKLQPGVKFHDGTAWDAKTAKWNLDRLILHPLSTIKANMKAVDVSKEDAEALTKMKADPGGPLTYESKAVEIVDPMTVKVKFTAPSASFMFSLTGAAASPISPVAYNKLGKDGFARNPVGAGPFKLAEWKTSNSITMDKNPDYWNKGADGQALPYLDKIVYRLIIDDSVRLLELKSGNAQFTELIQGKDVAGIKSEPTMNFVESPVSGNNYRVIFDSTNEESPFNKSLKLRQAMLYGLDREAMAKTLGFSSGLARKYLLPKGSMGYDESEKLPFYAYDKAKAQALVKEALAENPKLAGADGKIAFTFSVIDRAVDKAQSEMIKQMAEQIGFSVTLETLERAAWTAKLVKRPDQPGGKFDMASMRNPVTADDPDGQFRTFFYSSGSFNVAHIDDKEWDKAIDDAASTLDAAKRKQMYLDMEKKAFDSAWYGWLWQQNWNWAFNKKLNNFQEPATNQWWFADTWLV
jgi:peptide/nickel transport system substrate-binding protein